MRRLAVSALVLGLLVGTTTAFGVAEALKLERSPIGRVRLAHIFSPRCECGRATARLAFRLRRADTFDAVIVDADGNPVRTLAEGSRHARGRVILRWDGRTDDGAVVPDGSYRLRLDFSDEDRTIEVPKAVGVDTEAPEIELVRVAPRRLSPDGDGIRDEATVSFRISEPGRALLLVDGVVAARGQRQDAGTGALEWSGTVASREPRAGAHELALEARDIAGNLSAPTEETSIRIRYIALARAHLNVRRGGILRFRVLRDAAGLFHWRLFRSGHRARPVLWEGSLDNRVASRLPLRIHGGRYVLTVTDNGHSGDAIVIVRARR